MRQTTLLLCAVFALAGARPAIIRVATLAGARDAVRKPKAAGPLTAPVEVRLRGGVGTGISAILSRRPAEH